MVDAKSMVTASLNGISLGWQRVGMIVLLLTVPLPAAQAQSVDLRIRTVDVAELNGELIDFSLEQGLRLQPAAGGDPLHIPTGELVELHRETTPVQSATPAFQVLLAGGDRLLGQVGASPADQLLLHCRLHTALAIPLDRVQAVITPTGQKPFYRARLDQQLGRSRREDEVLLANGDTVQGFISVFTDQALQFEQGNNTTAIAYDLIVAVLLAEPQEPKRHGITAQLTFADGSRLTVNELRWSADRLELSYFDGTQLGLAAAELQQMEIRGGRWLWLQELDSLLYEQTPGLSLAWPMSRNRNVLGGPLHVGGQQFAHGLGVHSATRITLPLDGKFAALAIQCGLDDVAGQLGEVNASIRVDGVVRWEKNQIRADQPVQTIQVDLRGGKMLELRVDFGANGDIQDCFNWVDGILIKP
ncbi:MAG: hypothetical protein HJJLKODD_01764 [Phycisphaerae bacterium]|nr:hypothetical protein [Phycisphaerae bacterium]